MPEPQMPGAKITAAMRLRWLLLSAVGVFACAITFAAPPDPESTGDLLQPRTIPLAGMPVESNRAWSISNSDAGVVIGTKEGIIIPDGQLWKFVPSPENRPITTVGAIPSGYIVGGPDRAGYYDGQWHLTNVKGTIFSGYRVNGGPLFFDGTKTFSLNAAGAIDVKHQCDPAKGEFSALHRLGSELYLFTTTAAGSHQVYRWNGTAFAPTTAFAYLPGSLPAQFTNLNGTPIVFTEGQLWIGNRQVLAPALGARLKAELPCELSVLNAQPVIATYNGGIYGLTTAGEIAWHLDAEAVGGHVISTVAVDVGLIYTTHRHVGFLPDPARFRYRSISAMELVTLDETEAGIRVVTKQGDFTPSGPVRKADDVLLAYFQKGPLTLYGSFSGVTGTWGKIASITDIVFDLVPVGDGFLCASRPATLYGLDAQGALVWQRKLDQPINSMAATSNGEILIGTDRGVLRCQPGFNLVNAFGTERMIVKHSGGKAWAFNHTGTVLDENGALVAQVDCAALYDVAVYHGRLVGLVRGRSGWVALGYLDSWQPLQIPGVSEATRLVSVQGDKIYLASPELLVEAQAPSPEAAVALRPMRNFTPLGERVDVPADQSELSFVVPLATRPDLPAVRISYQVGDEHPQPHTGGAIILPRLPWGRTKIALTADNCGLITKSSFEVHRAFPWWLSAWAVISYVIAIGAGLFGLYRWRTRVLRARAAELENKIELRTAELVRAKRAREYFISAMSHEIRNPLNGVIGLCDILRETATSPREQTLTATLQGCADQLRNLLDDVLDWSRIERGEIEVTAAPFEICAALEAACRSMDATLSRVTLALPAAGWLLGDVTKVRQIVMNLVGNALKHGLPGPIAVEASVTSSGPTAQLGLCVRNPSRTFTAEEVEQFFGEYHRGTDATQRQTAGLGLGLNIARKLAVAMGGTLTGKAHAGRIEFTLALTLPVATAPSAPVAPVQHSRRIQVLAIEDEPYNRLVLGHILARLSCDVDWAEDGRSALECVRAGSYDLILTDYYLPDTTGVELAKTIRETLAAQCPPIVAVTAYSSPDKITEGLAAGIQFFVTKPVSLGKISAVIARFAPATTAGDLAGSHAESAVGDIPAEFDFAPILQLEQGLGLLPVYASSLLSGWLECQPLRGEASARAIHALRSKVLLVRASALSAQLELLETAARDGHHAVAVQLSSTIEHMLQQLVVAAEQAVKARLKPGSARAQSHSASVPAQS